MPRSPRPITVAANQRDHESIRRVRQSGSAQSIINGGGAEAVTTATLCQSAPYQKSSSIQRHFPPPDHEWPLHIRSRHPRLLTSHRRRLSHTYRHAFRRARACPPRQIPPIKLPSDETLPTGARLKPPPKAVGIPLQWEIARGGAGMSHHHTIASGCGMELCTPPLPHLCTTTATTAAAATGIGEVRLCD